MIGFEKEPAVFVYGDGEGNIIFEQADFEDNIVGVVKMSLQRFEDMMYMHFEELKSEAWNNPIIKGEKSE